MAVLGSGPAGFYTAYKVMTTIDGAVVDMYEHLPVPFGLVRFGVAPDHPEVKVDFYRFLYSYTCSATPYEPIVSPWTDQKHSNTRIVKKSSRRLPRTQISTSLEILTSAETYP